MTLKQFRVFICAFCLPLALSGCASRYNAVVNLPGGAIARMTVTPLFGFHSDWARVFTVDDDDTAASIDLYKDTGWWRGSHLYLHSSGTYVVHEGQMGCFGFTLEPVSFEVATSISCVKMADTAIRLPADSPELNGYPASKYYVGLFYVGRFVEASRIPELLGARAKTPVVFQTYEQQAEPELPEIL
ncbi:hypothetical protein RM543_00470 [Roseicyclus sp. F158]|uniref:Lipoprotein n=1 Tax=Tropicimonas omnivorans TaxID=3075590 RepID=A0ABU3DBR1_9RHOB|nr:hypothetical protein [Roseicyclus sp. F158]MDT0681141.1 hypothetical protein [Roseicyclus sp. F158]